MPHVVSTEIDAPPEKIALLAQLRAEARKRTDPHLAWLRCARPDQILPGGDWRILYYQGGRGCVAPETRIWLPLTGEHVPVADLAARGEPITVLALYPDGPAPAPAGAPFRKGTANLFVFCLEGGQSVTVTGEHRFLTPVGWRLARSLIPGNLLACGATLSWQRIYTITPAGTGPYYDLTVPGPANYLAEGIYHHNSGKALDSRTMIPVPSGWKTLGEIAVGDEVFDESGRICRVTATFDVMPEEAYRLTFSDGTTLDACVDHQWVTWTHLERTALLRSLGGATRRFPAEWPAWRRKHGHSRWDPQVYPEWQGPRVRTTGEIVKTIACNGKQQARNHCIPLCGPLDLPELDLPVDPYVLGVWLGDGSSAAGVVTISDADAEDMLGLLAAAGAPASGPPLRKEGAACAGYPIGGRAGVRDPVTGRMTPNGGLHSALRSLGLIKNKHVPAAYLRASAEQRLALLQGLMDTDGGWATSSRGAAAEFCSTKQSLALAVVELARSLGQKPVCAESRATLYGKDCGPRWRVTWTPTINVFRLPRKAGQFKADGEQSLRRYHRMIKSAELIDPMPMRCLTVDSPHSMYLAGEGMIPTHNTRSGTQGLAQLIREDKGDPGDWGIIAPTYQAAWTTCVEGPSGILAALGTSMAEIKEHRSATVASAYRTYGEITLHSGHVIRVDSANDGALRVQGKNLKGAYCSEIGLWLKWATAWDESIAYAVRLGESKIIACGTPKISRPAAKLIRRLLSGEPGVIVRRLRTVDNLANLSGAFYEAIVARASGTRLERQELEGELLDDVENALWTRDLLHAIQVDEIPGADAEHTGLHTVYVGVDPSDGGEESDEQAFAVVGQGEDYKLYVAESWGGRIGPVPFLKKAVLAAAKWHGTLVVEKNHGGEFLIETLRQVMRDLGVFVPYMKVHASLGKRSRAEPVAAMYERGVVRHVNGPHVDLEDQMAVFTGAARERSPDRLDALCWAATPFLNYDLGFPDPYKLGAKRWAQSRELDAMAGSQTLFRRRVIAGNYGENTTRQPGAWDLDTFAPQDDVGQGNRPNVKQWS